MLTRSSIAPLMFSAALVSACGAPGGLIAPSPVPVPAAPAAGATEMWNITVRLASVTGGECVGSTMQSQLGVPRSYTLAITPKGSTVDVTLRSTSGDYACTFPGARVEDGGFTTVGATAWISCETSIVTRNYSCADGTPRDVMRFGENISGHISGNQITGEWDVSWIVLEPGGDLGGSEDIAALETTSQYTGSR